VNVHTISNERLTLSDLSGILSEKSTLALGDGAVKRIQLCRDFLDRKIAGDQKPVYGINTGFGSLYNKNIPNWTKDSGRNCATHALS